MGYKITARSAHWHGTDYAQNGYTLREAICDYYGVTPPEVERLCPGYAQEDFDLDRWDTADSESDFQYLGQLVRGWRGTAFIGTAQERGAATV